MSAVEAAAAPGAPLSPIEALAVDFAAVRTFSIYCQATMLCALAEQRAVDGERALAFARMAGAIFRQTAVTTNGGKIPAHAATAIAGMFDELEATVRNMVTKPPGAGHA
jgi:hypothetical protein